MHTTRYSEFRVLIDGPLLLLLDLSALVGMAEKNETIPVYAYEGVNAADAYASYRFVPVECRVETPVDDLIAIETATRSRETDMSRNTKRK